jgi:hypothetical protein
MNASLMFILLLAGAAGDGAGLSFQAQLGYEPALLATGDDYAYTFDDLFPSLGEVCYFSHSLSGKIGIETENDWQMHAIGSVSQSVIPNGKVNISFGGWGFPVTRWVSQEFSVGAEAGYAFFGKKSSVYLGLELTWGKLSGSPEFHRGFGDDAESQIVHLTSTMLGLQGHIGIDIPLVSFGRFSLGLSPMLKGGAIKEQKAEGIPDDAVWAGPFTLSKWGVALGVNVNYDGGQRQ